ncbi:hypothetical protein Q5P01_025182 [Channa striata]|uniref:Uncharacterized protein n=1 Tax=Channa striata TaxID=64152 RepID=A0AA88LLC4_CHASR|nr:hypothetical protein Q5P01_025182 [Channa striata]
MEFHAAADSVLTTITKTDSQGGAVLQRRVRDLGGVKSCSSLPRHREPLLRLSKESRPCQDRIEQLYSLLWLIWRGRKYEGVKF